MIRIFSILFTVILLCTSISTQAQKANDPQELERQRQELKKEIDQAQQQLNETRKTTRTTLIAANQSQHIIDQQQKLLDNLNKQVKTIDNNITTSQRSVRQMSLLLDTLKQEYSKSMVYSYKNRNKADFLNFILSASSFNDAVKRITYLKEYRSFQELKGENIIRTQKLLKGRIDQLAENKQQKDAIVQTQSKEIDVLAQQQKQKQEIIEQLKKQGKELNKQIASKQKQMKKVSAAIAIAIRRAQDEARREATARAAADKAAAKRAAEEAKKEAAANPSVKPTVSKPVKTKAEPVQQESILLNSTNIATNASFEKNKGALPWPVDRGSVLMHYGNNTLPNGVVINISCTSVSAEIGTPVKSIFDGVVSAVKNADGIAYVIIQHGKYFSTYSNIGSVTIQKGQTVKTGEVIGKVLANDDGVGAMDIYISNEKSDLNPETWLRRR